MQRITWGFIKTFFVTYGFVYGTEVEWSTTEHVMFSIWLAVIGALVGLTQSIYDHLRKPKIELGDEPTNDDDDADHYAI